jgi:predicted Zn finger-like uncharacterized protein
MIKFTCSNCSKKISTPDKSAGKRGKCPQCGHILRVPTPHKEILQDDQTIIKFRCPHCNQKIAVTENYIGKRVKCAKCRQPFKVPEPQKEVEKKDTVPGNIESDEKFDKDMGIADIFGEKSLTDELLAAEANAPAIEQELQLKPVTPESISRQAQTFEAGVYSDDHSYTVDSGAAARGIKNMGKIPLAIVASFGFTLVGAMIWAWFSSLFGANWFGFVDIMVIPVIALAALGLIIFIENRNMGIGLLAALIGLSGAVSGKAFIAKWAILPEMEKILTAELSEKPIFRDTILSDFDINKILAFKKPSDQLLANLVENENSMFLFVCMQLAENGEFELEFAWQVAAAHASGKVPLEKAEEIKVANEKVEAMLKSSGPGEKERIVRAQYSKVMERVRKLFMETEIGFVIAFIATFSLWDLLWIPMGLWSAYKIGAGRD